MTKRISVKYNQTIKVISGSLNAYVMRTLRLILGIVLLMVTVLVIIHIVCFRFENPEMGAIDILKAKWLYAVWLLPIWFILHFICDKNLENE